MELRKFIISLVSKFDARGFKDANKEGKKLAKTATKASKSFDKMAGSMKKAAAGAAALAKAEKKAGDEAEAAGRKAKVAGKGAEKAATDFSGFGKALGGLGNLARSATVALTALGAAGVAVATGVISTGVSFESLRARLKTVEGSAEGAQAAFAQIQEFTKTTPFQLEEVTTAFVRLKSLGLDASKESLTAFGNLAAAQGKSVIDFIEAVADASTGEFERLKEFGIKARTEGEQVTFTFKGQQTTIAKNADAIQGFLRGLGETEFAGAMDDQMATAAGAISNLKDTFFTFLDTVAQMGVLDEFKLLLGDLSAAAGGEGFAGIIAEALVTGLKALREALASVTEQDIREFLEAVVELAESFASVLGVVVAAMEVFTIASGDTTTAVENMTLAVFALVAAFQGPAGLVVAAGAAGVVLGRMLANLVLDLDGTNERIAETEARIAGLRKSIAASEAAIAESERNIAASKQRVAAAEEAGRKKRAERLERVAGGLGSGLVRELDAEEAGFQAQFIELGNKESQRKAKQKLLTDEGRAVLAAVEQAEATKISKIEARARREARRRGANPEEAAAAARASATTAAGAQRKKAFEQATKVFAETGSAEAAALAASRQVEGRGKKGARKKGKGDTFFQFEQDAERAARQQAEEFAADTLRQLRAEGVAVDEALEQSREAGRQRAKDLKQQFLDAGRIFDASANNILDVLGLRGPGSVLENRPPPQSLIISINPEINFIKEFNFNVDRVAGTQDLEDVTGEAGKAAIEAGLEPSRKKFEVMWDAMFNLRVEQLLKADGGGTLPQGPEQG